MLKAFTLNGGEEVDASDALNLVDAIDIVAFGAVARFVAIDESDSLMERRDIDNLEERVGHDDLLSNLLMLATEEDGTSHDVDLPILFRPLAALDFHLVPIARVEVVVLRTDVSHKETFLLRLLTPFVVARRTHVTTVVA